MRWELAIIPDRNACLIKLPRNAFRNGLVGSRIRDEDVANQPPPYRRAVLSLLMGLDRWLVHRSAQDQAAGGSEWISSSWLSRAELLISQRGGKLPLTPMGTLARRSHSCDGSDWRRLCSRRIGFDGEPSGFVQRKWQDAAVLA
jgi:hypothetical protein